jgi:hypothetical protein
MATMDGDRRPLHEIAESCGTDKVPNCRVYDRYFASLRDQPLNLLEIGVGGYDDPASGGDSLRMWREYFSAGRIYGIDMYDKSQHRSDRIITYRGSQDDERFLSFVADQIGEIDIIIDDGSHFSPHVIKSFEVLFPRLRYGGIYVVEDVGTSYWPDYQGSKDFSDPNTSMSFLKSLADGIMHPFSRVEHDWRYVDLHAHSLHFYPNIVFIMKK